MGLYQIVKKNKKKLSDSRHIDATCTYIGPKGPKSLDFFPPMQRAPLKGRNPQPTWSLP